jgi:hypothetical protein
VFGFLLVAWFGLPGSPAAWTAVALLALAAPALTETAEGLLSMRIFRASSRRLRSVLARARRSIALKTVSPRASDRVSPDCSSRYRSLRARTVRVGAGDDVRRQEYRTYIYRPLPRASLW